MRKARGPPTPIWLMAGTDRRAPRAAADEGLDAEARRSRIFTERGRILTAIKGFFGLES